VETPVTPDQILANLDDLLGFAPQIGDLVIVGLNPGAQVTMRIDLTDLDDDLATGQLPDRLPVELAAHLRRALNHAGATSVVTITYSHDLDPTRARKLTDQIAGWNLHILGVITSDTRVWQDALTGSETCQCDGPACQCSGVNPTSRTTSRDDLIATIAYDPAALTRSVVRDGGNLADPDQHNGDYPVHLEHLAHLAAHPDARPGVDVDTLAYALTLIGSAVTTRDLLLIHLARNLEGATRRQITHTAHVAVRTAALTEDPLALSLAATMLYITGNGTLTRAVCRRIEAGSTGANMAGILTNAMDAGMHPKTLTGALGTIDTEQVLTASTTSTATG